MKIFFDCIRFQEREKIRSRKRKTSSRFLQRCISSSIFANRYLCLFYGIQEVGKTYAGLSWVRRQDKIRTQGQEILLWWLSQQALQRQTQARAYISKKSSGFAWPELWTAWWYTQVRAGFGRFYLSDDLGVQSGCRDILSPLQTPWYLWMFWHHIQDVWVEDIFHIENTKCFVTFAGRWWNETSVN